MVWNDDLSFLAELNTKQCQLKHDACRNTAQFSFSGQNLGSLGKSNSHYDPAVVVNNTVNSWFNEYSNALQSDIDLLSKINNQK